MMARETTWRVHACYERIYQIVRDIPYGKVMTYGQIAELAAEVCRSPAPAIQVGRAMAASGEYAPDLPWWRVIGKTGASGVLRKRQLWQLQRDLLAREGVVADADGRYDLARYRYDPDA